LSVHIVFVVDLVGGSSCLDRECFLGGSAVRKRYTKCGL
jgi:hypothetical protein